MTLGLASRPLIRVKAADFTRSKSAASQRGSVKTSCTSATVSSKFLASVVAEIVNSCALAETEMPEPNSPTACSNSAAVLVAVPSSIKSAKSESRPFLS